jgi:uncharacterized protein YjlB
MALSSPSSVSSVRVASDHAIHPSGVITHTLTDDGIFPNNPNLPVLVYPEAVSLVVHDPAAVFEALFTTHGWGNGWRNGIYGFHHYHSTAHEVLGVFRGHATVQCGGEHGITLSIQAGDVIVIPVGVAHKNVGCSRDFGVVGAYPFGQNWDTCYGRPGERPQADRNITRVALPQADPVHGAHGPLVTHWRLS